MWAVTSAIKMSKRTLFENSSGDKSSSIVLEYLFFLALAILIGYSVVTGKDIPSNTMTLLKWLGIALTCGAEGYKLNDRLCSYNEKKELIKKNEVKHDDWNRF